MSCKLPQGMFEWVKGEDISIDNIMNYIEVTDNEAFISEVDQNIQMKYTIYTMIILLPVKGFNQKGIIVLNFVEHLTTKRIILHILKPTIIFKTWFKN